LDYLLIAFIIVVVLSPLAWLKTSPGQVRVTAFRKRAAELGLKVQLVPAPDAEEADKRPSAVCYCMFHNHAERGERNPQATNWILLHNQRRGWDSPWESWRWFRHQPGEEQYPCIESLVKAVPTNVYAIRANPFGICLYLNETGDIRQIDEMATALRAFLDRQ